MADSTILMYSIILGMVSLAFFLFIRAVRKNRPDLKVWMIAVGTYALASLLRVLNGVNISSLDFIIIVAFSGLAVLLMCVATILQYRDIFTKKKVIRNFKTSYATIALIFLAPDIDWATIGLYIVIGSLLIFCIFLLIRIYRKLRTPTHQFLLYTMLSGLGTIIVSTFETLGFPYMPEGSQAFDVIVATMLLITAIVINIEDRMVSYNEQVEKNAEKMKLQLKRSKEISENLSLAAEELSSSAEEVSASSENIASSQQQISRGATNQALSINKTQAVFTAFTEGLRSVEKKVGDVSEISEILTSLSENTNMLSLNAAIEAARAGEAGRGFSVVADQVRRLAEESQNAVKDSESLTQEIIQIIKEQTANAVEILQSVDQIATVAEETSATTEESAAAAEEQAASMETIASTAQYLMELAERLVKQDFDKL